MAGLSNSGGGGGSGAIRAGRAFVELFANDNKVYRALARLEDRFRAFGAFVAKIGVVTGGVGTAVTAAFKPALDALSDNAKIADLADLFELSGEKASRLFGIMAAGGSDLRDAQEGLVTFNQRINDALQGTGEEAKVLFRELGMSAEEFANLDTADRFYKLIDAVQKSNSPLGKLGLLMKAVGEDTGKNLGGVIELTTDQIRELGDAMETSSADLNAAREAARAQKIAAAQLGAAWSQVASAIAPSVKEFAGDVARAAKIAADFASKNRETIAIVLKVAAALTVAGAAIVGFGTLSAAAGASIGAVVAIVKGLAAAVGALVSPIGLATAAVVGLGYLFVTETETGAAFFESVKNGFQEVAGVAVEAWGGIVAAIGKGDLALAGEIALTALEVLWAKAVARMEEVWADFKGFFVDGWHEITDGLAEPLSQLVDEVVRAHEWIWEQVKGVIEAIKEAWNSVEDTVMQVIDFLKPALAPIVGPFLLIASLIQEAWENASTNITENIVKIGSWVEKVFAQMEAAITNPLRRAVSTILSLAITAASAADRLDPTDTLKGAITFAEALRANVDSTMVDADAKAKAIDERRDKILADLKQQREDERAAREAGRAEDVANANAKARELEAKLSALAARARAPAAAAAAFMEFGGGGDFGPAVARAADISGSRGSFTAASAAQRFGSESIQKQQLSELKGINGGVQAVARAVGDVAKGLVFG